MSLSQMLIDNINNQFVFHSNQREIQLTETNKKYSINIRISGKQNILLIKNIEDLKQRYLPYTTGKFMPKDCDYILIREEKKEIFFLELKSESQKRFKKQKKI